MTLGLITKIWLISIILTSIVYGLVYFTLSLSQTVGIISLLPITFGLIYVCSKIGEWLA